MYELKKMLEKMGYKRRISQAPVNMEEALTLDGFIFNMYMRLSLATQHTMGIMNQSVMNWLRNHGHDYWINEEEGFINDLSECEEKLDKFFQYIELEEAYVFLPVYQFYAMEQMRMLFEGNFNETT